MAKTLSEEAYNRKIKRDIEYNANHTTRLPINLNHNTDNDILAYLQTVTNKQGLIKELLRARMSEDGFTYSAPDHDTEETE